MLLQALVSLFLLNINNHKYMNSLIKHSLNISEQEYHELPVWSHSLIADYARNGFGSLATLHDKKAPTPSMEFGSLFDSMITKGKKTLDEYVVDGTACAPKEKSVFDWLLSHGHTEPFKEIEFNELDIAMESCDYYKNRKPETRREQLEKASAYYDVRRQGKKLVSKEDWDDAIEMYRTFRSDPYLKELFGTKNSKDKEYIYQAQFMVPWIIDGKQIDVKIMPDLLVVDHKEKTIQPVDLKTSSMPAYNFAENFVKYRYRHSN